MNEQGLSDEINIDFLEFSNWVRKEYEYPSSANIAGWDKCILAISMNISAKNLDWENLPEINSDQHIKSIELFIELLKKFVLSKTISKKINSSN